VVQLVREFETVALRIEFWVVIEVAIGVAWNITERLQVLVGSFAVTEREEVERNLSVGQFNAGIFEESIRRLEEVKALGTCLRRLARRLLQLRMSQNHLRNLEEDHLSANLLDNAIR
jgi:hypothetical protein